MNFFWGISEVHPMSRQVATIITHMSNMSPSKTSSSEGIKWWKPCWEFTQNRSPTRYHPPKKKCLRRWYPATVRGSRIYSKVPIVCKIFARKAGQRAFVDCNKLAHQQGMIQNMWQPFLMYPFELRSHYRHVSHHNKHTRSVKI